MSTYTPPRSFPVEGRLSLVRSRSQYGDLHFGFGHTFGCLCGFLWYHSCPHRLHFNFFGSNSWPHDGQITM